MSRIAGKITRFTQKEIDKLFDTAQRQVRNPALDILLGPRQKNFGRILIIISRKVGNAPERNKIRRRLKSIFYKEKLYETPYDYIVIVKKEAVALSFEALKELLCRAYSEKKNQVIQ